MPPYQVRGRLLKSGMTKGLNLWTDINYQLIPHLYPLHRGWGRDEEEGTTRYILQFDFQFFSPVLPQKYCLSNHELQGLPYGSVIIYLKLSIIEV